MLTVEERQTLAEWGLLEEYIDHKDELIEVARIAYWAVHGANIQPSRDEAFARALAVSLLASRVFSGMIKRTSFGVKREVQEVFAEMMAKYLIDKEWDGIIR